MSDTGERDNLRGGLWLVADMSLNIWSLSIVKLLGADYSSVQIVFIRAIVGFALIAPLIRHERDAFRSTPNLGLHLIRVLLSVITLSASFFAIARVPLALFTAINFTRPVVTMVLAAVILSETIGTRRWLAAGVALTGVLIATNPGTVAWSWGLMALALVVVSGSGAIIATRYLRDTPSIVLMTFYTGGLTLFTAPFAFTTWQPVATDHILPLLLVGCFAQAAQLCFLRAHYFGGAGFLSVLGYLSLVLSVGVGYFVFNETPTAAFALGALLVVAAALWVTVDHRALRFRT